MSDRPIDTVLHELKRAGCKPQRAGSNWQACCPAHEDSRPSLSITEAQSGKVLVRCHAGCDYRSVCESLGLKVGDLFPSDEQPLPKRSPKARKPAQDFDSPEAAIAAYERKLGPQAHRWDYHDADGKLVGVVLRWDSDSGKEIRPIAATADGRWTLGQMPELRPLYRLPEVLDADRVFVCEGEKAADAVRSVGLTATTSAGGSQAPSKTDWTPLAGKDVVILPDNDEPGRNYGQTVAKLLLQLANPATVRIVELPDLPPKGDAADWRDMQPEGLSDVELKRQLRSLADAAKRLQPDDTDGETEFLRRKLMLPDLIGVIRRGHVHATYELEMADGSPIVLGSARDLLSPYKIRERLFDERGHLIPGDKRGWPQVALALRTVARQVETGDRTHFDELLEDFEASNAVKLWGRENEHAVGSREWKIAVYSELEKESSHGHSGCFRDESGNLCVSLPKLYAYLTDSRRERYTTSQVRAELTRRGFESERRTVRDSDGEQRRPRIWVRREPT